MLVCVVLCVFFFKQKTAYEMRISDWSSDVCSSDLQSMPAYARRGGADLVLRLQCNTLRLKAAMIDPRVDVALGKRAVHMIGPALAPLLDQRGLVPFAHLCAKAVFRDLSHRQHHMGVRLGPTVLADVPMDIEIGDHAFLTQLGLHNLSPQLDFVLFLPLPPQSQNAL